VKSNEPGRNRKAKNRSARPSAEPALPRAPSPYKRHALAALALCALTLLAYSNSFGGRLVLDNKVLLLDPRIREATPENIALIFQHTYWWPTGEAGLYRPFTTLSYLFNYATLGQGDQLPGYHAIHLILHLGNVLLAYALALRLVRRFWPSVFIAAVWAVHPASTESVTNIVGRADLLAGMAVLSGFLMYLKSRDASGWARAMWLAGLAAVTTIGVFSKESAVAILPVIVLYELVWWKGKKGTDDISGGPVLTMRRWPEMSSVPFLAIPIAAMLWKRFAVLAASPPAEFPYTDNPIVGADWWTGRLTAIKVIARYLWLTIWPANLSCDYSFGQIPLARGTAADWFACVIVFATAIAVILLYRWNRTAFFLACFAFLNFVPASNLFFPIGTIMADRLLYLPSLGLLACMVLAVYAVAEKPKFALVAPVVLGVIVAGFAVRTWMRNQDWETELALATHDVRVSPRSYKLHQLLAASLFESDPAHSNIDQVIEEQGNALALLDPLPAALSRPESYRQAGYYQLLKGDRDHERDARQGTAAYRNALQAIERCIAIDQASRGSYLTRAGSISPAIRVAELREGDSQAYLLLSLVYVRLGELDKAYATINQARTLDPLNPQMYRQLSAVLAQQGRNAEAEVAFMQETAITSLREGKWRDAADSSERVLQADSAGYPSAYYLNAMANLRIGNLDAAEKSSREAIRLDTAQSNPRTSYVLGLVLAEKREYAEAVDSLNAYLRAAPNAPDSETVRKQLSNIEQLAKSQGVPPVHP
jgi:tetratricopeptide (TPR) repeat protein